MTFGWRSMRARPKETLGPQVAAWIAAAAAMILAAFAYTTTTAVRNIMAL